MSRPAMLFAAGFGTRMRDLTRTRPKPLIPLAGRALIDHALAHARAVAAAPIVVNTHYRADQIAAHLAGSGDVIVSDEQPDILDTGGGLRAARPLLGAGPVFTLNSDAVFSGPEPLPRLDSAWMPDIMDALLLLVTQPNALGHAGPGDFIQSGDGRLARVAAGGSGVPGIYTGAQIIRTDGLAAIPDRVFSLNRLWDQMARAGRLFGLFYPGRWADVGTPEGLDLAAALLAGHV